MSAQVLKLTGQSIELAIQQRNAPLLEKETMFVMGSLALTISEVFSNILNVVKPIHVQLKNMSELLDRAAFQESLKSMLNLISRLYNHQVDFNEAKLNFDQWFYEITDKGILEVEYKSESLVSITDAAEELGVSRTMIYKYIDRGLETVGEKGSQKIPRQVLEAWKNPAHAVKIQWIHGVKRSRTQSLEQRLEYINKQISEFEKEYGGTFYHLFGKLTSEEINSHDEAFDISDWSRLEVQKQDLLNRLKG